MIQQNETWFFHPIRSILSFLTVCKLKKKVSQCHIHGITNMRKILIHIICPSFKEYYTKSSSQTYKAKSHQRYSIALWTLLFLRYGFLPDRHISLYILVCTKDRWKITIASELPILGRPRHHSGLGKSQTYRSLINRQIVGNGSEVEGNPLWCSQYLRDSPRPAHLREHVENAFVFDTSPRLFWFT